MVMTVPLTKKYIYLYIIKSILLHCISYALTKKGNVKKYFLVFKSNNSIVSNILFLLESG